ASYRVRGAAARLPDVHPARDRCHQGRRRGGRLNSEPAAQARDSLPLLARRARTGNPGGQPMIRSAVTVSLVEEARGGPFVFWFDLPAACAKAQDLGFDAIELFPPGPDA